jgi:hypothetical protein
MNKFLKSILALGVTSALSLTAANAATYQVIDKGDVASLKYTYSQQENNVNEMAISGTNVYNFPVQFQYLTETDYDNIKSSANSGHISVHELNDLEDFDALKAGTPTANDFAWVVRFLRGQANNSLYQQVGDIIAMTNRNGNTEEVTIFDSNLPNTDELTRSTVDFVNGITNEGWIYGNASAPYLPLDFTESDGDLVTHWVREFNTRGYLSTDNGQTIVPVIAPENRYGGESAILDISDNRFAVGYASTGVSQAKLDVIESGDGGCSDPENLKDLPFEVCVQRLLSEFYNLQAFKWTLDPTGIVATENLGLLVTPHVDDTRAYPGFAQALNSSGVAVGFAHGWWDETETSPAANEARSLYAVVYKNGEVTDFTADHSKYFDSRAFDINDRGFAIGHAKTFAAGDQRTKFYFVDTNAETMEMVLPTDFFTGSSSTARAINENNLVVGDGEVETHSDASNNPRRRHGFLYDITNDSFTDLNDFLSCNSDYTIIEARDINDNNEISATAIINVPRRDAKGALMLSDDGTQLTEDVVRAIKLAPTSGEIEDCSKVEEKVERKGAGFGFGTLLVLVLVGLRRKFNQ